MHDCLIIGGGVIGLSIAWELSHHGVSALILEQSEFGRESSWAGAGMLPPGNPRTASTPEARLRSSSHELWPEWSDALREATGIDNGFRRCGGLEVRFAGPADELVSEAAHWRDAGVACELLSPSTARQFEPHLGAELSSAYFLPEFGQVRNPRHLKALHAACASRGVTLQSGTPVLGFRRKGQMLTHAITGSGTIPAREFVVAGGAWSQSLLSEFGQSLRVHPVRGQIALLNQLPSPITRVINIGAQYLVPRGDGRILVGATEEEAGFDRRTTAVGIAGLLALATRLVPELAQATFERSWAGLRPGSIDGLPYLGRMPGAENLLVATGHFRAGLQLSPITAQLIGQLIRRVATTIPLDGLEPDRKAPS